MMGIDKLCYSFQLSALLEKGAVIQVRNPQLQGSFYSTLFLVPKKGGQMRPVINLKNLNKWVTAQHFKMEGMGTLRQLLRVNDWMVKVDLKDAYFTVPIHPSHQSYLRFMVGQEHYQFTYLPFGLSCAPWVVTKVMKPIAIFLCSMGMYMIVYIDDIFLMGDSPDQVESHLETDIPTNKSDQYPQTDNDTHSGNRIPGPTGELNHPTPKVTRRETPPYQDGGESNSPEITSDSPATGTDNREAECSFPGSNACSLVLPVPERGPTESSEEQQPELQSSTVTISASSRRAFVVARKIDTLEWQSPSTPTGNHDYRVRCIPTRLGSSVQWHQDRRSLESIGETNAHKLPGIIGSNLSSEILCEGSNRDCSTATAGQSNSCSIYQQHGGTVSPQLIDLTKALWMWALSKDIVLPAEYIPVTMNCIANAESRTLTDRTDWKLHPQLSK